MADENADNDDNEANVNDLGSPSPNDNVFDDTQWIDDESIAAANARAREEGTTNGYHTAVDNFLKWNISNKDKNVCSNVLTESEEDENVIEFDAEKLAKSMEDLKGPYFQYTRQVQLDMNRKGQSGMGKTCQLVGPII